VYLGKIYEYPGQRQRAMAEYTKAVNTKDDTQWSQAEPIMAGDSVHEGAQP